MSRATRDAAAAAEIQFVRFVLHTSCKATAFALRNADRMTSLGSYHATNIASIQPFSQLQHLVLTLESKRKEAALLPCYLTKLFITLRSMRMKWKIFPPLCCLQELDLHVRDRPSGGVVQLSDTFATALPLLTVFHVQTWKWHGTVLETTAKAVMPHLVELDIALMKIMHLDLRFMSAPRSLDLYDCTVSTVSAACSTMVLDRLDGIGEGTVLVTPNLRSLTTVGHRGVGLYKLDGSGCRLALSIVCKLGSIEWVGAKPKVETFRGMVHP